MHRGVLVLLGSALLTGCGQSGAVDSVVAPSPETSAPTSAATSTPSATAAATQKSGGRASAAPARTSAAATPTAVRTTQHPQPSSSASGTLVVTDDANGSTVRLHPGQRLEVRLSQDSYDPPESSAPATLVSRGSQGGYPTADPVDAAFEAQKAGTADVSTNSDYACFHTSPQCYRPTRLWVLHVIVG